MRREAARAAASLTEPLLAKTLRLRARLERAGGRSRRASLADPWAPTAGKSGGDLDHRLAALQSLDALDIAAKMKLFG